MNLVEIADRMNRELSAKESAIMQALHRHAISIVEQTLPSLQLIAEVEFLLFRKTAVKSSNRCQDEYHASVGIRGPESREAVYATIQIDDISYADLSKSQAEMLWIVGDEIREMVQALKYNWALYHCSNLWC